MLDFSDTLHEAMAKTDVLTLIDRLTMATITPDLFSKWLLWVLVALSGELKYYYRDKKSFDN